MRTRLSVIGFLAFTLACGREQAPLEGPDAPLSWEDFVARVHQEPDTGVYVHNGDELAEDVPQLRSSYAAYLAERGVPGAQRLDASRQGLIVNLVNGQDDKWSSTQAQSLTYCVDKKSFGSRYAAVVDAMAQAATAWEATAAVNFVHASQYDDRSCNNRNGSVVFDVKQVCRGQYLARAFFPSTSRKGREVLVDCTSFGSIAPWTLAGVLRHELGHTIGLRHEHTRPEAGTCFENSSWRALTAYDSASVMHYPQCNGTNDGDLVLTAADQDGARQLYP